MQTSAAPASAPARAIPDHVPPELVREIGLTYAPDYLAAPYRFMADLHRTQPPIFFAPSEHAAPAWMFIKYDDVFHALRNSDVFRTGSLGIFPREGENSFPMLPIEIDPPEHRKYRAVLDPLLANHAVARLEADVRALANRLIDGFIERGGCEFTTDFGRPLPVSVFLQFMGLPLEMRDTFVGWAMALLHSHDRAAAGKAMMETCAYLHGAIAGKKAQPDAGAVSTIVHSRPGGEAMTDKEAFGFVFFLFIAGLDTVFATLNNIFLWLARHPDGRRHIRATPDRLAANAEELIRVYGTTFSGRELAQDYEMRGVKLKKGDRVTCVLPAANYDPDVFERPEEVDFGRPRKLNLSFTAGPHICMGAPLARLEIKIAIDEFLRRMPDFRLKEGTQVEYWGGGVVGPKLLPLEWER